VLSTKSRADQAVEERALNYDEAGRLFGILAQRPEPIGRRARTALLFLNVGSNHHVGPHRMYVTLGRELSALGFSAFRFDVAGLGDSRPPPGIKENLLYSRSSILDVQQAMTFLSRTIGAERFVLIGICSGAYLAFHTTVADSRVSGQILVNPQTFQWRGGDSPRAQDQEGEPKPIRFIATPFREGHLGASVRQEINLRGIAGEPPSVVRAQKPASRASARPPPCPRRGRRRSPLFRRHLRSRFALAPRL
jgi:hypothetical protein